MMAGVHGAVRLNQAQEELKRAVTAIWDAVEKQDTDRLQQLRPTQQRLEREIEHLKKTAKVQKDAARRALSRSDVLAIAKKPEEELGELAEELLEARRSMDLEGAVEIKERMQKLQARLEVEKLKKKSERRALPSSGPGPLALADNAAENDDANAAATDTDTAAALALLEIESKIASGSSEPSRKPRKPRPPVTVQSFMRTYVLAPSASSTRPLTRTAERFVTVHDELEQDLVDGRLEDAIESARNLKRFQPQWQEVKDAAKQDRTKQFLQLQEELEQALDSEDLELAKQLLQRRKALEAEILERVARARAAATARAKGAPKAKAKGKARPKTAAKIASEPPAVSEAVRSSQQVMNEEANAKGGPLLPKEAREKVEALQHEVELINEGLQDYPEDDDSKEPTRLRERRQALESEIAEIKHLGRVPEKIDAKEAFFAKLNAVVR